MNDFLLPTWCGVQMQNRNSLRPEPLFGLLGQVTIAGREFLRLDIPACGQREARTVFLRPDAVDFIEVVSEEQARAAQARWHARPDPTGEAFNS